jgi:cysteine desulfurase
MLYERAMDAVYLDNAATTRVADEVAAAMMHALTVDYGNPSSAHRLGGAAARLVAEARERVARSLGAEARDVYFTSGGTEANALGTLGAVDDAPGRRGRHVVVSAIEHPSVMEAARRLRERGFELTEVAPTRGGVVPVEALVAAVREDTALVSLMRVSNELGTVQPSFEAARAVKAKAPRAHFHVDAVQALGKLAVDVGAGPIDSLAISAHKIHGPKGAGALWLRRGARLTSLTVGGGQERGVRPGTENVAGAVGFGLAAELAERARPEAAARMAALRERLVAGARAAFPSLRENADPAHAAPHIVSLGFPGVAAEPLLHALEHHGVYVSAGSACAAKDRKPSAVLRAIGVPDDVGVLRFSFGRFSDEAAVERAIAALQQALAELG